MSAVATTVRLDGALDGARILWRWFLTSDDRKPNEGYVREFSPTGQRVRISRTVEELDYGDWMEVAPLRVVEVLEEQSVQRHLRELLAAQKAAAEKAAKKKKRRHDRIEGDEWKDADGEELDLGD